MSLTNSLIDRAAIANGTDPRLWTLSNIAKMKQQLLQCGIEFDWYVGSAIICTQKRKELSNESHM